MGRLPKCGFTPYRMSKTTLRRNMQLALLNVLEMTTTAIVRSAGQTHCRNVRCTFPKLEELIETEVPISSWGGVSQSVKKPSQS